MEAGYNKTDYTMKKLLFFVAVLLLCSACGSNSKGDPQGKMKEVSERTGWDGPALYGDVKSVTFKLYSLTEKFGEEVLGDLWEHHVYHFSQSHGNWSEYIRLQTG